MTVSTTTNRSTGTGDGSTVAFPYTFAIQQSNDMDVYLDGTLQATGYSVSINSNGVGGNVTFTTAPTSGRAVLMVRTVDLTQTTALPIEGNIPESTLEDMADKNTMMSQQINEKIGRGLSVPITSTLSGVATNEPSVSKCLIRLNNAGTAFEFASPATIFNESTPASGGGNVTGTGSGATNYGIVLYNGTTGLTLRNGPGVGTSGQILVSAGAGALPVWTTKNFLLKAANIESSLRALPTSGALSGTYVHFGNWSSTGALTFSNDTRIYVKGSFTLGHTLTGTTQSNGGVSPSSYHGHWGRGGGPGAGEPGHAVHGVTGIGGGSGGGCGGAGGNGGFAAASTSNSGGKAHSSLLSGGSGGGAGAGDLGGTNKGSAGGGGGPFIYIEVDGAITLNETISSNGAAGTIGSSTGGAGGGGAGGIIYIRGTSTFTIATTKKVTANGGNGGAYGTTGAKGGGGGGGIVDIWTGGAHTLPDGAGTHVTASAGTKGTGTDSTTAASDGSAGTTSLLASAQPISLF